VHGKQIKVEQIQVYMRARAKDMTQFQASEIAGFSDRSARRIESARHQPGREKPPGRKPDPLALVWEQVLQPKLEADPRLKPRTLCKTICFSKSKWLHDAVIGLFINRYEFGLDV
jgi:hypothetical protein